MQIRMAMAIIIRKKTEPSTISTFIKEKFKTIKIHYLIDNLPIMTVRSVSELGSYEATLVVVEVVVVGSKILKFYFFYNLNLKRNLNHAFLIDTKQKYNILQNKEKK